MPSFGHARAVQKHRHSAQKLLPFRRQRLPAASTRAERGPSEGRGRTPRANSRVAPPAATAGRGRRGRAPLRTADPAVGPRAPAARQTFAAEQKRRVTPAQSPARVGGREGERESSRPRAAPRAPSRPPSGPGPRALTMSYTLRITSWFAIAGGPRAPRARWLLPWGGAAQAGGGAVGTPGGRFLLVPPVAAGRGGAAGTMEPPPRRNGARPAGGALSPRPAAGAGRRGAGPAPTDGSGRRRGERERRLPGGPGTVGARQAESPSDGRKMEPLEPAPTFRQERDGGDYSSRRAARLPACPAPPTPRRSVALRGRGAPCRAVPCRAVCRERSPRDGVCPRARCAAGSCGTHTPPEAQVRPRLSGSSESGVQPSGPSGLRGPLAGTARGARRAVGPTARGRALRLLLWLAAGIGLVATNRRCGGKKPLSYQGVLRKMGSYLKTVIVKTSSDNRGSPSS